MKYFNNLYTLSVLFFVFSFSAHAQIRIGTKGGINLSSWHGEGSEGAKLKPGFHAGVLFQIPIGAELRFQPELEFSREGANSEQLKVVQDYINVPLLLRFMNRSGFFYESGILVGYLISAQGKIGGVSVDIKDQIFKSFDFAIVGGLGYQINQNLGVGARYNLGLANISADKGSSIGNSVIQIGAFYLFDHKAIAKK